ncbi:C5a anaphylatoxin chemotactic receptor 2 isoform X1 [Arvicanthis niloticus]|uniref:C5a anaphylatoxin chemotactic receptor 2 isoform X1 n=1 Tax=Arvicanthis niloticus TaxID=61156 RepID=UPI00402B2E5B
MKYEGLGDTSVSGSRMMNYTTMEDYDYEYEYDQEHYSDLLDIPVDCPAGNCFSSDVYLIVLLVLYAAVFLVGVPGNTLVAWVTWKESRHRLGASWFLHLTMADLLCCVSLPFLAVPIAQKGHWPYGTAGCWLLSSITVLSMYASVLLLTGLSGDLFLLAFRPSWKGADQRTLGVRVVQASSWILALLLTVPSAVYRRLLQEHYPPQLVCGTNYGGSVAAEAAITTVRFLFGFLGPLVFMASCHGILQWQLARRHWPLGTAVVVGFFFCWTPYHILRVIIAVAPPYSLLLARVLEVEPLVTGLALGHSALNPVMFLYFGRKQLCKSLQAACHWALRDPQDEESAVTKVSTSHEMVSEMPV